MATHKIAGFGLVFALFLSAGCFDSKYTVGTLTDATFDKSYAGIFTARDGNDTITITICNLDDTQYYVEWSEGKHEPLRMVAFTAEAAGKTFANLRGLTTDGSVAEVYLIDRVSLSADHSTLTIWDLDDKFFKGLKINSNADLRAVIEKNVDNEKMYDGKPIVATRVIASSQPATRGS